MPRAAPGAPPGSSPSSASPWPLRSRAPREAGSAAGLQAGAVHRRLGDQARQLAHGSPKLGREPARTQLLEPAGERPVVPAHVFGPATASAPKLLSLVQV